jgi:hypothetical protein
MDQFDKHWIEYAGWKREVNRRLNDAGLQLLTATQVLRGLQVSPEHLSRS